MAVLSLPPLGEDLGSELDQRVLAYNEVTRPAADAHGATYLPLHERLVRLLDERAVPCVLNDRAGAIVVDLVSAWLGVA